MKKLTLISIALTLTCKISLSFAACDDSIALRYLASIDAMNWTQMERLLAEDAWYSDPTMAHFDRPPIDLRGASQIVDFWRSSSEQSGTSEIEYRVTSCFETAGYFMVNMAIRISVAGAYWNVAKETIVIPGNLLSIIRVIDDRVAEHHDYVDYAGADAVIAALQKQHGTVRGKDTQ